VASRLHRPLVPLFVPFCAGHRSEQVSLPHLLLLVGDPHLIATIAKTLSLGKSDVNRELVQCGTCGYASALLLQQDFAYSYRVWITLNKPLYAPLQYLKIKPDIHQGERLCGGLLPAVRRVSEKNSSRQLAEQGRRSKLLALNTRSPAKIVHITHVAILPLMPLCRWE
jgi:hypothetical protein